MVFTACGSLGPARTDAGVDGGGANATGGGGQGRSLSWSASTLSVSPLPVGGVPEMATSRDAVFAIVGGTTVLASTGGPFIVTLEIAEAVHGLAVTEGEAVGVSYLSYWLHCDAQCATTPDYDFEAIGSVISACRSRDTLSVMTTTTDAGAALIDDRFDAGRLIRFKVNVTAPQSCVRLDDGHFMIGSRGAVTTVSDAGVQTFVPDVSAFGRDSSLERWQSMTVRGARVLAGSNRGAVVLGTTVTQRFTDGAVLVSLTGTDDAWAFGSGTVQHFDGTAWHDEGTAPAALTVESFAVTADAIYVGGRDSSGMPMIQSAPRLH